MLKAEVAIVKIGDRRIEGLRFEDGSYGVAIPQLVELNLVPPNRSQKQIERLLGIDFPSHQKARTTLNSKAVNSIDLKDLERLIFESALRKVSEAVEIARELIGLSLTQLWADAFNDKFEKEERQAYLKARQEGKVVRKTWTDAIAHYKDTHTDLSDNEKRWMYTNCSDILNRAIFGKSAKQLCEERKSNRDELRNTHSAEDLRTIEYVENLAMNKVFKKDVHPVDAIKQAIEELV